LDKILSTRAVAIALDVSERTVRKLCEIGSLPHYRIGKLYRIRQSDLESYLRERYPAVCRVDMDHRGDCVGGGVDSLVVGKSHQ
jgi:excisionase family DNA binding protein